MKKKTRRRRGVVTMHDVAKHVGMSPMTISRVINGDAKVRAETRQRPGRHLEAPLFAECSRAQSRQGLHASHRAALQQPEQRLMNELLVGVLEQSSHAGCQVLLKEISLRSAGRTLGPLQHFLKFSLIKRESSGAL